MSFYSLCERHLLPFFGHVDVAYIPSGRVIDGSRLPRLIEALSRRLQLQQRLTDQLARAIHTAVRPRGVGVRLEAAHLCNVMRGIDRRPSVTMTTCFLGAFDQSMALCREFYAALATGIAPGSLHESRSGAPTDANPALEACEAAPLSPVPAHRVGVITRDAPRVPPSTNSEAVGPGLRGVGGEER
jgi:hypothetical protein